MQTSATTPEQLSRRFSVAARLLKNDNAALSREDKAAFGIDPWQTELDTPEELRSRVAAWLAELSANRAAFIAPAGWKFEPMPETLHSLKDVAGRLFTFTADQRLAAVKDCGRDADAHYGICFILKELGLVDHTRWRALELEIARLYRVHHATA